MKVDFSSRSRGGKKNNNEGGGSSNNNSIDIRLNGMVAYDKLRLIQDMMKGTKIVFGKVPKKENLESDFDIIVDSTGFHRNYLPKLNDEMWIPCVQYKVKYDIDKIPFDDFYLKAFPSMTDTFGIFLSGNGYAAYRRRNIQRKYNNELVR